MKMNSLSDAKIIAKLYEASAAGVKIRLIVRGICCLKNDIPGVSENIEVHSIVGRLLEHSRIYYFYNGGREDLFFSSADMMTRNLNRRVEILFPILQPDLRARGIKIFANMWKDNVKARKLVGSKFERIDRRGLTAFNSQEYFIQEAEEKREELKKATSEKKNSHSESFTPLMQKDIGLNSKEDDNE